MGALDFNGREQLYYQLYNILFQDIINGKYAIGSLIPAESELMKTYHVSRATARKAMEMLAQHGLVNKRQGHGTTVISHQPNNSPRRVVRYTKKNEVDHVTAIKKLVSKRILPAEQCMAEALNLPIGSELIELKRVRYADTEPFYLEINCFEKAYVPEVMNRDFSQESLRVFLSNVYHIKWYIAKQEIYSIVADETIAELLHISIGDPLIYIRRISYDADNIPREFVATYYRADKYHLEIELAIDAC